MLFRAIALSLALMIGIGAIVPLATEYAEAGPKKTKRYKKKKPRKYKKYSKGWWRQYRARMKRKKALQARKRALRLRQLRLAKAAKASDPKAKKTEAKPTADTQSTALLPSGQAAPKGWKAAKSSPGELLFQIDGSSGSIGSASISVVGPAMGDSVNAGRNPTLAGVPTTSLRREVINRMIRENGWVVNDYQKEVGGRSVYVVVAQSQATGGRVSSRMFYFTEADGRIYSVATNSAAESAEKLAEESEKVINSLQSRPRPVQQAGLKN
jgi:hypothetical protein